MHDYLMYIDGEFCSASDGATFETINPATGEAWDTAPAATEDDVDRAVKAAHRALHEGPWADMTATERGKLLFVLADLLAEHSERRTEDGNAGVVRNGHLPERELQTGLGPVTVQIPKVRAKTGEPVTFHSALVPPYVRKTRSLEAALPWLYLKGISSGEMAEALKVLVGPDADGMSASTVSRLKQVWAQEYRSWCEERLDKDTGCMYGPTVSTAT